MYDWGAGRWTVAQRDRADLSVLQEEGALIIEGLLNIAWGLRRPIRLQMQDDREPAHLSSASWLPARASCPP